MFGTAISHTRKRLAMAAAVACLAGSGLAGLAAAPAQAYGAGEVCMFNAPTGAELGPWTLGHVGWGYLVGGTSTWVFGATESPTWAWSASGSWSTMLDAFKYANHPGYYTQFNCSTSTNSAVGAANNLVAWYDDIAKSGYGIANNNCLTHAVAIFQMYDSGTFGGMRDGSFAGPNHYFDGLPGTAHFWLHPSRL